MQGLWSRTARLPSASCKCVACLRTAANEIAARPAATANGGRGLRVGNAVTALYSSIFAGAAIADAIVKRKRLQEWNDKIAAVKEEVDELIYEERRILEVLSTRKPSHTLRSRLYDTFSRSVLATTTNSFRGRPHPRLMVAGVGQTQGNLTQRFISTHTGLGNRDANFTDVSRGVDGASDVQEALGGHWEEELGDDAIENDDSDLPIKRPEPDFIWEQESIVRTKAIQKLAVQQLVYRLILRSSVIHDYGGEPVNYNLDESMEQSSPNVMLSRLRAIRRRLYSLKYIRAANYDDLMQNIGIEEFDEQRRELREKHDIRLNRDIEQYLQGKMHIQELLFAVADNLLSCSEPDRTSIFTALIFAFSKTHQNDLVDTLLQCLIPNMFHISTPLIITTLAHFRKTKNLKDFDQYLQMLRGEGGYTPNLRTLWSEMTINGIRITVPPLNTYNPVIITSLVTASLRFDQPEQAAAYLQVARSQGFMENFDTLSAYLRFYSARRDIQNGLSTMLTALEFLTASTSLEERRVTRLILYMIDFCNNCNQEDLAVTLIHAAVRSGIDCHVGYRKGRFLSSTFQKWKTAQDHYKLRDQEQPLPEKCAGFASVALPKILHLRDSYRATPPRDLNESYSKVKFNRRNDTPQKTQYQMQNTSSRTPEPQEEMSDLLRELKLVQARIKRLCPTDPPLQTLHGEDHRESASSSS